MGLEFGWRGDSASDDAFAWSASRRSIPWIEVARVEGNRAASASSARGSPICLHLQNGVGTAGKKSEWSVKKTRLDNHPNILVPSIEFLALIAPDEPRFPTLDDISWPELIQILGSARDPDPDIGLGPFGKKDTPPGHLR